MSENLILFITSFIGAGIGSAIMTIISYKKGVQHGIELERMRQEQLRQNDRDLDESNRR